MNFKKILAAVLTGAMCLSMSVSAFASPENGKNELTIYNADGTSDVVVIDGEVTQNAIDKVFAEHAKPIGRPAPEQIELYMPCPNSSDGVHDYWYREVGGRYDGPHSNPVYGQWCSYSVYQKMACSCNAQIVMEKAFYRHQHGIN